MAILQGVDYSSTANANWDQLAAALKAAGKHFVGRYAVGDKSPGGRGIGADEYAAMKAAGIDVFLYWESSAGWMAGGYTAGSNAARNAQANIVAAGIPENTPVYFACDFDAEPSDQAAIDDCLRGAASVLGFERVGLYAGYHVLLRSKQNGTANWFCQTSAWSGGMVMDGVHLYQYDYNKYVYGTNCDWVQAYTENYGQATPPVIIEPPKAPDAPVYESADTWDWLKVGGEGFGEDHMIGETEVIYAPADFATQKKTPRYATGNKRGPKSGPDIKKGTQFHSDYAFRSATDNLTYRLTVNGNRVLASALLPRDGVSKNGTLSRRAEKGGKPTVIRKRSKK